LNWDRPQSHCLSEHLSSISAVVCCGNATHVNAMKYLRQDNETCEDTRARLLFSEWWNAIVFLHAAQLLSSPYKNKYSWFNYKSGKVFRIGTVRYNWPVSAHASQAFSIVHCTDSEELPKPAKHKLQRARAKVRYSMEHWSWHCSFVLLMGNCNTDSKPNSIPNSRFPEWSTPQQCQQPGSAMKQRLLLNNCLILLD